MTRNSVKHAHVGDAGTVMVDALVAVVIASLMAAICLTSLQISRRADTAAQADRKARLLLQALMETTPRTPGVYSGKTDGMTYAVTVTEQRTDSTRLCAVRAEAGQKGRVWRLEGTRWCDREALS
jgi:adenosylmethionine-8-amino-7-oxononanoate aminotransferase